MRGRPEVSIRGYKTKQIDKARVCKLASLWGACSHQLRVEGQREDVPKSQPEARGFSTADITQTSASRASSPPTSAHVSLGSWSGLEVFVH